MSAPDIGVAPISGSASGAGLSTSVRRGHRCVPRRSNEACVDRQLRERSDGRGQRGDNTSSIWKYAKPVRTRADGREHTTGNRDQRPGSKLELLTTLASNTKQVQPGQYLGAVRDTLATVDLTRAQYIQSHRLPTDASMTAIFPAWVGTCSGPISPREQP